jgi:CopG family nickel-responsive transcriptional regulator
VEPVKRFGVSMDAELLRHFDRLSQRKGYKTRSEAIRDLVRQAIVQEEWEAADAEVVGAVTIVYDHHRHDLVDALQELQHHAHDAVICNTHVHLDARNCLENIVLKGRSGAVRRLADQLISTKGVKHGGLVSTTTGRKLT